MGLRDIGASLPPGFRFYPSDEELVCHYLYKKITNEEVLKGTLVEIDLHICEPWQLPEVAKLNANEWYFFSFRDRKYATGFRTNRATTSGYWKATGKDRTVHDPITQEVVGMRKTLVFYRNRAPNGIKTGWIMHEFRLETPHMPPKEDWVLCRVFHKSKETDNNNNIINITTTAKLNNMYDDTATHHQSSPSMHPAVAVAGGGYNRLLTASSLSSNSFLNHPNNNNNNNHHQNGYAIDLLHLTNASSSTVTQISSDPKGGGDDGYGFIWDMDLEDRSLDDGVASNLDGMRFELDINNNNNHMVLL